MEIQKSLLKIQSELKVAKNQRNNFGKYNYRSAEDILEAVKPILNKNNCVLILTDKVKELGGVLFVEATAILSDGVDYIKVKSQAGIDPNKKGMDISQTFGSSSSYSRKYALNGMFLIDDTKDADATNTHGKNNTVKPLTEKEISVIKLKITASSNRDELTSLWNSDARIKTNKEISKMFSDRSAELSNQKKNN